MISLHIVYQDDVGKAVSAARVNDRELLVETARRAVKEARNRAMSLKRLDSLIGGFQQEEADRLEKFLSILIPELKGEKKCESSDKRNL